MPERPNQPARAAAGWPGEAHREAEHADIPEGQVGKSPVAVSEMMISSISTAASAAAVRAATPATSATASSSSTQPCASTRITARPDAGTGPVHTRSTGMAGQARGNRPCEHEAEQHPGGDRSPRRGELARPRRLGPGGGRGVRSDGARGPADRRPGTGPPDLLTG